jgi:hypothetical protein
MRQTTSPIDNDRLAERALAYLSLMAMIAATFGGVVAWRFGDVQAQLLIAFGTLLVTASAGMVADAAIKRAHYAELARAYARVMKGQPSAPPPLTGRSSISGALATLIDHARLAFFGGRRLARWAVDVDLQIAARRQQSERTAALLMEDAAIIQQAASGTRGAEQVVEAALRSARGSANAAVMATQGMVDQAAQIADTVRALTIYTKRASQSAATLSDTAHGTQRGVAGMTEALTAMLAAVDQVSMVLQRAQKLGEEAGVKAAQAEGAGHGLAAIAADMKALADASATALEAINAGIKSLRSQADDVATSVAALDDAVQAQTQASQTMATAAARQAQAVEQVLAGASNAFQEIQEARGQLHRIALPESRLGNGTQAQAAVERLPAHAEALAQILRGLPNVTNRTSNEAELYWWI